MLNFDYLIVGAGLFGSVIARELTNAGKKCLVIDKRSHVGGNIYCEKVDNINIHKYGAHIFHTDNEEVWRYVNKYVEFNRYTNSPIANYKGEIYNLPFNMNTFNKMWGVTTPEQAKEKIAIQVRESGITEPKNLEEKAISLVGKDIYLKLIKGYTEKQWGRKATELPSFIINRLPLRFIYDNNYFNDRYQGIPIGGYSVLINKLLDGASVILNEDFFANREKYSECAKKIIFTGQIDAFYDYSLGALEYRSLEFEQCKLNMDNYQGVAVVNYTDFDTPYTRVIEHKHFENAISENTVITKEYPKNWSIGDEPYYPINNSVNNDLFMKYLQLAKHDEKVIFAGRLGEYKYYDMDDTVEKALQLAKKLV